MKLITQEQLNEKKYSANDVAEMFKKFYNQVKHGDEEHQKWLLEETLSFIAENIIKETKTN